MYSIKISFVLFLYVIKMQVTLLVVITNTCTFIRNLGINMHIKRDVSYAQDAGPFQYW